MPKKSLQKKVAILNEYIDKELEKEVSSELDQINKDSVTAKTEKKYQRNGYPHYSRNHYFT